MDICYYYSHLIEEFEGARDYIQYAINLKESNPNWAEAYKKMSLQELDHASTLMKIFEDNFKMAAKDDLIYETSHSVINNLYSENYAKVMYMHQLYDKKVTF
jgi:hypothetical protein